MKKNKNYATIVLLIISTLVGLIIVSSAQAETLLGKNYIGSSFGITKFGDDVLDEIFETGYRLEAVGNLNLNSNIDFLVDAEYLWADGEIGDVEVDLSGLSAKGEIIYFNRSDEKINPFLGAGVIILKSKVQASAFGLIEERDETDLGGVLNAGVELEFTEKTLFRFDLDYFRVNGMESTDGNISFGYWFNEMIIGVIGGSYDFDHGNIIAQIGLVIKR